MKFALAQIDPTVGAFEANIQKILEVYQRACRDDCDFVVTPELAVCGYPPHDLLERPEIFERNEKALVVLARATEDQQTALIVGHVSQNKKNEGHAAQNTVSVLQGGKVVFQQSKTLLPTYDVFDEARYFEPATEIQLWNYQDRKNQNHRIALAICEDLWAGYPVLGREIYRKRKPPAECYAELGAELVISLSASPYEWAKQELREKIHREVAQSLKAPVFYVNAVGATDEMLFDGASFGVDAKGALMGKLPAFETAYAEIEDSVWKGPQAEPLSEISTLARGLICGIREYFKRTGFKKAVMGLSGGIDSAVVAALAVQALGAKNILGVAMPSQYSSGHSLEDAEALAKKLGILFEVRPIKFLYSIFSKELKEKRGELAPVAEENLQSRIRGNILMTLANHYSALVLTTGNKSELAMGYCTQYGDMVGALAPIGDLFKTRVYELAGFLNQTYGNPIPERSVTKAPSAELRPNQTDQDSLPPYEDLDAVLEDYLEKRQSVSELLKTYENRLSLRGRIPEILKKIEINEFKRRQAAPVLKTSPKAFGIGRRIPIAKLWEG